jgi:hypothetical protein
MRILAGAVIALGAIAVGAGPAAAAPGEFPGAGKYTSASQADCQTSHDNAVRDYNIAKQRQDAQDEATRNAGKLPPYRAGHFSISACSGFGASWSYEVSYPS